MGKLITGENENKQGQVLLSRSWTQIVIRGAPSIEANNQLKTAQTQFEKQADDAGYLAGVSCTRRLYSVDSAPSSSPRINRDAPMTVRCQLNST